MISLNTHVHMAKTTFLSPRGFGNLERAPGAV